MSTITSLTAFLVRRKRPLMVAPPAAVPGPFEIDYELEFAEAAPAAEAALPAPSRWGEDVRFFVTCYAVGLVFFLVMLS
jgi:hypothetical protein